MWNDSESSSASDGEKEDKKSSKHTAADDEISNSSEEQDDSEYEEKNEPEEEEESSSSEESEHSKSSNASVEKKVNRKNSRGMDSKTRKLLEDEKLLRRSQRSRKQGSKSSEEESASAEESDAEWDDRKRKTSRAKAKSRKAAKNTSTGIVRRGTTKKSIDYAEKSSDEDIDEDEVLEWEIENPKLDESTSQTTAECVERIIKSRIGIPGATGSHTTCYNVAEKGDPNAASEDKTEEQFLIKWVGWSHMHNTWESEASLAAMGVKGLKRLQNYIKRQSEVDSWRRTADKEYIEFYDCEQVMAEELCDEYKKAERIVAHQKSRDKSADGGDVIEYFVKWTGLPYSDCTWEDMKLLPQERIDEYHRRIDNLKSPVKTSAVLRRRPRFAKLDVMPDFLRVEGRNQQLRDYQLEGLNWMLHAWCKSNSSILADEMGLGKTIQSISFLASLFHRYDLYGPFLVVVPLSTMAAWQKEFAQWAPALNLVVYMGDVVSREQIRQYEWYVGGTKRMKVNAILTTYEILLKDKAFLSSFDWAALLVDEAHRLKNDESLLYKCLSQFRFNHKLLITGTPLQNSIKELWALLHFIMPEKFDSWEEFESDHNDKDHKGISALHRKLEPFLLRRVKKDVEKSLPPKLEQILRVDMTAHQKQFYKWILTKNYRELSNGVKGSINGFVNLVMELKKCCNHASLVRQPDYMDQDAQSRLQQLLKSSGKLILLDKLLCRLKDTGHRVLIFSQMVMMLDILQEYLQLRRFPSQRLDGSMRADVRKQALDHFNAEGSNDFAFLLSTRAGGLGINLATADTVIIFDSDWNPQNDLQAMSRAHRIGQTRQVNIYRLVTKGSVEEDIVERAKRKLVLDHLVIQRMDTTGKTVLSKSTANGSVPFDKQELNAILKFGAAELFKEKEGEEKEPEVDIDRILLGAETTETDETLKENELLSSFKYATFAFDEEKDVAAATDEWDSIIPEDDRMRILEEERLKELAEINLAPRVRAKVQIEESDGGDDDDDAEGEETTARPKKKKAFGKFSLTEVKRCVRSLRKFAQPLERLEALAQDAEIEEHSSEEVKELVEELLKGCKKAMEEHEKTNGEKKENEKVVFKLAQCEVNVRLVHKCHQELEPLHVALSDSEKASNWKPPRNSKPQKGWDVEWTWIDDGALLWGVYKYGYGSWESIKMDPQLGLADKIFIKDKTKKPQGKNLQQRVDYLLRAMRKGDVEPKKPTERKRKIENGHEKASPEKKKRDSEVARPVKRDADSHKEKAVSRSEKTFGDQLALLSIDKSMYGAALEDKSSKAFIECVKLCHPVHKYMKKLKDAQDAKKEEDEAKYITRLGDSFRECLEDLVKRKPKTNVRKWYNYLWIFLCKFVSREPAELVERYRVLTSLNKHRNHHHHHHHHHKNKEKDKDKEHRRSQLKEKHPKRQ